MATTVWLAWDKQGERRKQWRAMLAEQEANLRRDRLKILCWDRDGFAV